MSANRGTRTYDWKNFLLGLQPEVPVDVQVRKDCRRAINSPLVAARRLGLYLKTKCRQCGDTAILTLTIQENPTIP